MQTHNLGYPRIGSQRELKRASELYWAGKLSPHELMQAGSAIRRQNWALQKKAGIDLIPCNDFSFYDQVLDTSIMVGAIPERFHDLATEKQLPQIDLLFAMARGYQQDGYDITAMEMTKWFDTNYHYIVPEFTATQTFSLFSNKLLLDFLEAKEIGVAAKPVLLGPVSFLLLGKEKEPGFNRITLIDKLLPVYLELLEKLEKAGAYYVQMDEPCLSLDLTDMERKAFQKVYQEIRNRRPDLRIILASYFECYGENLECVLRLPVHVLHLDLVRCPAQLDDVLNTSFVQSHGILSLGLVDGRNIWKNDFEKSLEVVRTAVAVVGAERVWLAPSCSLLHVPCDLDLETNEKVLTPEIKQWMSFAKQKLNEVVALKKLSQDISEPDLNQYLEASRAAALTRATSALIHDQRVKARLNAITGQEVDRNSTFAERKKEQREHLRLPLFPTTTIGSFPQTAEVRSWRAQWKKKALTQEEYDKRIARETEKAIRWQEEIGLDVMVHGEFERNDMVEYFGEQLKGFVFSQHGWVQSYGSRCVKPPIIYGDVSRPLPMTLRWTAFAQSLTNKPVKGMLTGPVTILQWSFVRNDQPRRVTCNQIALAIRDEVMDLEQAGIGIIQIDEPAIREGLPLRRANREAYLEWAVKAFRMAAATVKNRTQIHTHMCYSEFNDMISHIAAMDADVITIECSRSQMELLDAFAEFRYPNEIGPGVYDIHAPRIPSRTEMVRLMEKAGEVIPADQLWVNPDCGLKTRGWPETKAALIEMVEAARMLRASVSTEMV